MSDKKQKLLLKISAAIAVVTLTLAISFIEFPAKESQVSVVNSVIQLTSPYKVTPADLSFEEVDYQKVQQSTGHYETYKVKVRIRNRGGNIINRNVHLLVGNEKIPVTNNPDNTFSLRENQEHLLNSFEVKFDKRLNGQSIPIKIEITDQEDLNLNNNSYDLYITAYPALLKNVSLTYNKDKQLIATFDRQIDLSNYVMQIVSIPKDKVLTGKETVIYKEVNLDNTIFQYNLIQADQDNSPLRIPSEPATFTEENHLIITRTNLEKSENYIQIRAINSENHNYLVSDIIRLPLTEEAPLNRAQFAKLFIEEAGIPLYRGQTLFNDIPNDQWYTPYAETLHNLGLLVSPSENEYKFSPEALISRGEALKIILDYFDINLLVGNFTNTYLDVTESNKYYFYVETLRADDNTSFIDQRFNTNHPATRAFVTNIINLYKTQ
jgi:hypothetical protein